MEKIGLLFALIRAKTYVVVTDTKAAISFRGKRPDRFEDFIALTTQTAALALLHEKLGELIEEHHNAIDTWQGDEDE